jgi:hypothetical protein
VFGDSRKTGNDIEESMEFLHVTIESLKVELASEVPPHLRLYPRILIALAIL